MLGRNAKRDRGHAIVIGGSMAGMLAARVLHEHFGRVTIIDRDRYGEDGEYRSGVPQSRHLHICLERGQQILHELFPDLEVELNDAGVPLLNIGLDLSTVAFGGPLPRYRSKHQIRSSSRVWLESTVRRRLRLRNGITFLEETEVTGLLARPREGVYGVQLRRRGQSNEGMQADFVVDASGRNSKALDWLGVLGYEHASITTINAFLGYATRWFRKPARFEAAWRAALIGSIPTSNSRAGALFPVEGDRWVVTLSGLAEQQPPADDAGFLGFARQLATPTIYHAIQHAEPISPAYGYRRTENRWVHFERLARWPERFIVMGDAACCFNPIYGQGMTIAALEADLLDRMLLQHGADLRWFARKFQRQLPKTLMPAWLLSTGEDFRWPTTAGGKPDAATRCAHWYVDRLIHAMPHYQPMLEAFLSVQHLLAAPTTLFRPSVSARVLSHALRSFVEQRARGASPGELKV